MTESGARVCAWKWPPPAVTFRDGGARKGGFGIGTELQWAFNRWQLGTSASLGANLINGKRPSAL